VTVTASPFAARAIRPINQMINLFMALCPESFRYAVRSARVGETGPVVQVKSDPERQLEEKFY
jgi:hypothetical protein